MNAIANLTNKHTDKPQVILSDYQHGLETLADGKMKVLKLQPDNVDYRFMMKIYEKTEQFMTHEILRKTINYLDETSIKFPDYKDFLTAAKQNGWPYRKFSERGTCTMNLCDGSGVVTAVKNHAEYVFRCRCVNGMALPYSIDDDYCMRVWGSNVVKDGYELLQVYHDNQATNNKYVEPIKTVKDINSSVKNIIELFSNS